MRLMNFKLCIVGTGYVGLPLAVEFGKYFQTIAFDIDKKKINLLKKKQDKTKQISNLQFLKSNKLKFSSNINDLGQSNIYIVTVPTPILKNNNPDLRPLISASKLISQKIKKNDIVIYESTVYPGVTRNICAPILEKYSNLKFNIDFFCGYSPERINPGDKKHTIVNIKKIVSASNLKTLKIINNLYKKIIKAGTYMAESIEIAEAAKVIENTQRDVNIALINEFSIIFNKLNIDTNSILKASSTKWNFLNFKPGLVGGHCIGVDPYYLTYVSQKLGYEPKVILSGRNINDNMHNYVTKRIINNLKKNNSSIENKKALLLGLTFKEDCPDFRNSKSIDLYFALCKKFKNVHAYDPYIKNKSLIINGKNINVINKFEKKKFDVIIISVSHKIFTKKNSMYYFKLLKKNGFIFDIKNILPNDPKILKL